MRASTRHSMKRLRYCGIPRLGSHSLPIHSWFISPNAKFCNRHTNDNKMMNMINITGLNHISDMTNCQLYSINQRNNINQTRLRSLWFLATSIGGNFCRHRMDRAVYLCIAFAAFY